ncbi:lanthionine synthetase LanC family protein [Demetria terragena]|uniref:lanthionine synthetase LanC family protein n=1 Tax=Demetria terragena TaxID=63959 RepID=UPI0003784A83|nr:lanthionine synthetase LanC family protein [Demetria terragena]
MSEELRRRAREAAALMADRLSDPLEVGRRTASIPSNGPAAWDPSSLTRGPAALALLAAEDGRERSAATLSTAWRLTASATSHSAVNGPFGGLGALASLARCVNASDEVQARLDARIAEHARWLGTALDAQLGRGEPAYVGTIDTLGGLAGEGRHLLARGHPGAADVATALATLARPLSVRGVVVPGWWSAPTERTVVAPEFQDGRLCFGLAHGIAGPLMFLALAHEQGIQSAETDAATLSLADELWSWRQHDQHGPFWTPYLPLTRIAHPDATPSPDPARASWCYGSLGIAQVLDQVGRAHAQPTWRARARDVALAQLARPAPEWGIQDVGLCHGWASHLVLLTTLAHRGVLDPHEADVEAALRHAAQNTLRQVDPSTQFGVQMPHPESGATLDLPGLLEGAAGVALALLMYGRDCPPATDWDTLLLLR